jgi:cobalt-precorrin-5B (C1)-methyltransferase
MKDRFVTKNGKNLRYGFTTGSCAAAAAKASVIMLIEKKVIEQIEIETPKGWNLVLKIENAEIGKDFAKCAVVKDSGDDPDVTNCIKIFAKATGSDDPVIEISGGEGIGIVTKKGLSVDIGNPAINPVPMRMIVNEVKKVLPEGKGVKIEISAPEGIELAKKTFNPKLGIIGGISIIGTSGIVEPMSEESFKDTLALKLSVLKEEGIECCVFTPGNYGEKFLSDNYKINSNIVVVTGNFIGFMLEKAVCYGIKNILLAGYIGKLIKVAGGIFHTHSHIADARNEILAANYGYYTGDMNILKKIMDSNTSEEAIEYIEDENFFKYIACKIKTKCEEHVYGEINIEVILISQNKGRLAETDGAKNILNYVQK